MDTPVGSNAPDLFSKVGPLPAWGWGVLAVGGYLFWSHRQPATVPDTTDATMTGADTAAQDPAYADGLLSPVSSADAGYNYGDVLAGQYTGTVAGSTFVSNQQWAAYVIQNMVALGFPASTTTTAVTHYLSGGRLTAAEAQIINQAITNFGPPPLPQPLNVIAPTVAPTGAPAAPHLSGHSANGHAVFSWPKVANAVAYQIVYRGTAGRITRGLSYTSGKYRKGYHYGPLAVKAIGSNGKVSGASNPVSVVIA